MGDILIGKTYTWEKMTISFLKNCTISIPWSMGIGTYQWVDKNTIHATWSNILHILVFNSTFTEFKSFRKDTGTVVNGSLTTLHSQSKFPSLYIDYKNSVSDLCLLSKQYNIDKSSQRDNPASNDGNHCHPYSLLYNALFHKNRNDAINFCEIGIAEGRSLCMWNDYFPNAQIYGYEYMKQWLDSWKNSHSDKSRITVNYMNVMNDPELIGPLREVNVQYDCIIDDSTHYYYDMIRIIYRAVSFLKPGGMIIIEDIRKAFDESWFYADLKDVKDEFEQIFFVDLEHDRRNSGMVNNDKVLILIKKGDPIFNYSLP
uniref:Methyltransferase n=1 Tax=viral metagenome TaxID=1070528 RepID=A0A6C0DJB7_9ZZZZ